MKPLLKKFWIASKSLLLIAIATPTQAQIVPDGTTPTATSGCAANCEITGGTQAGANLFHSFEKFNIDLGQQVYFIDPGVKNIFSRVTGGSPSNILGTLGVSGGNANLFLINPKGIVFGPNASLNIGGAFVATTADAIQFGSRGNFSATMPQNNAELLTVAPSALLFNQVNAQTRGKIAADGAFLSVASGKNLSLVGGEVNINGSYLNAPSGYINIAGVASGSVGVNSNASDIQFSFASDVAKANVSLTNGSLIGVTGTGSGSTNINANNLNIENSIIQAGIDSGTATSSNPGDININASGKITMVSSGIANEVLPEAQGDAGGIKIRGASLSLTDNATLSTSALGAGDAGGIDLQIGNEINLTNNAQIFSFSTAGNAGDIRINTGGLTLNNANLNANSFGKGNAGNVSVRAQNTVALNAASTISTTTEAPNGEGGNGGDIDITAEKVTLSEKSALYTSTTGSGGRAGNVNITATDTVAPTNSAIFSDTSGQGNAGNTTINTQRLTLDAGGRVSSSTASSGNAGNIQITANDVSIFGVNPNGLTLSGALLNTTSSGVFVTTQKAASGAGGNIQVNTDKLYIADGAVLSARTENAAPGGNITVNANTIDLINGGQIITSALDRGSAGSISVNASGKVKISGSDRTFSQRWQQADGIVDNDGAASGLLAQVRGKATATAGTIQVTAPTIQLDDRATITTATTSGAGGEIILNARNVLLGNQSTITATAGTSAAGGNGGNISINSDFLIASNNSDITANAFSGNGGNIDIETRGLFLSPDSEITASSERGIDGTVEVNRPEADPTAGIITLVTQPVDIAQLIAQGCKPSLTTGRIDTSELVITGRGGLPPTPGEALNGETILADLGGEVSNAQATIAQTSSAPASQTTNNSNSLEAQGWVLGKSGEVMLTAQAPKIALNVPWLTPAACNAS